MERLEQYKESFDEKFSRKEEIEVLDGVIEAVDLTPENPKSEVPILFAPGWISSPETYKDTIKALYEKDHRVLSIWQAREGISTKEVSDELKNKYPEVELRKAFALLSILDQRHIEKTDVIAHSEGAINAVIAAQIAPERFRSLVFINPGGLVGRQESGKMLARTVLKLIKDSAKIILESDKETKGRWNRGGKEVAKYVFKNPSRAWEEAKAVSRSEIQEEMRELREKGIKVAVIAGVDDAAFPMEDMQKTVKANQIDGFVSVEKGHNEIFLQPEKYATVAEELLESLNKK